ncbi:MAG: DUF5908 family protein [Spirosomataceae bacterium]
MPLEIRELHIKAVINQGAQSAGGNAGSGGRGNASTDGDAPDKEDIVAECVEKVLAVLRDKIER